MPSLRPLALAVLGQEEQRQQDQHRGGQLDRELGERQVGRGEFDEQQGAAQTGQAQYDEREDAAVAEPHRAHRPQHRQRNEGEDGQVLGFQRRQRPHTKAPRGRAKERTGAEDERTEQDEHGVARQRVGVAELGDAAGKPIHEPEPLVVERHALGESRDAATHRGQSLSVEEQHDAHPNGQRAHQEREVEPVPQVDRDLRCLGSEYADTDELQGGLDDHGRRHADQQAQRDQQPHRRLHPRRRWVRSLLELAGLLPEEDAPNEAHRVRNAQRAADRGEAGHDPPRQRHRAAHFEGLLEEHLFGQEPVEQWDPCHGRGRNHGEERCGSHVLGQPAQLVETAGAGLVVDDARGHEERSLERGVVDDVEHRRDHAHGRVQAHQRGDQAQVGNGGVREQAFDVALEQRHEGCEHHRGQADGGDDAKPQRRARKRGPQSDEQKNARLHHRRRVQVRACRRGGRHRTGQPEVERDLRRLGEDAEQDQGEQVGVARVGNDDVVRCQHGGELVAAHDVAEQQHAAEQTQTTKSGDPQSPPGPPACLGLVVLERDQQEAADGRQLPEHHQPKEVLRGDDPEHRPHEQQEERKEPIVTVERGQVVAAVQDHQEPDPQNERAHQQSEPVEPERQVHPQRRHPGDPRQHDLSFEHRRHDLQERDDRQRRDPACTPRGTIAARDPAAPQGHPTQEKRDCDDEVQPHGDGLEPNAEDPRPPPV